MIPEDQKKLTTQWCSTGRLFTAATQGSPSIPNICSDINTRVKLVKQEYKTSFPKWLQHKHQIICKMSPSQTSNYLQNVSNTNIKLFAKCLQHKHQIICKMSQTQTSNYLQNVSNTNIKLFAKCLQHKHQIICKMSPTQTSSYLQNKSVFSKNHYLKNNTLKTSSHNIEIRITLNSIYNWTLITLFKFRLQQTGVLAYALA